MRLGAYYAKVYIPIEKITMSSQEEFYPPVSYYFFDILIDCTKTATDGYLDISIAIYGISTC